MELLPVDQLGRISLEAMREKTSSETDLVSIMWGNNEIGTVQPIAEIAVLCADRGDLAKKASRPAAMTVIAYNRRAGK